MIITESNKYQKSYKKLIKKNSKEFIRIENIKNIIINSKNLHELILCPYKDMYHIEKKKANLKEYYTARVNSKMRLLLKPVGEYPYKDLEIDEIIFDDLDNKQYGDG